MNAPYILYYLFQNFSFPPHLYSNPWGCVSSPDFWNTAQKIIALFHSLLLSMAFFPFILYISKWAPLKTYALLKRYPFPALHLHAILPESCFHSRPPSTFPLLPLSPFLPHPLESELYPLFLIPNLPLDYLLLVRIPLLTDSC